MKEGPAVQLRPVIREHPAASSDGLRKTAIDTAHKRNITSPTADARGYHPTFEHQQASWGSIPGNVAEMGRQVSFSALTLRRLGSDRHRSL